MADHDRAVAPLTPQPLDAEALYRAVAAHEQAGTPEEGLALLAPALDAETPVSLWLQHARLAALLARFDPRRQDDALAAAERAREAAERAGDPAALAAALVLVGRSHYHRAMTAGGGDYDLPMGLFRRALALAEASGDDVATSDAAHRVGLAHERKNELAEAHTQHSRAYALAAAGGHTAEQAHAARHLGFLAFFLHGDPDAALARFEESAALFEAAGCRWVLPMAWQVVGSAHFLGRKDPVRAEPHYRRALALAEELGRPLLVAEMLSSLGELLAATGRPDEARAAYARCLTTAETFEHRRLAAEVAAKLAGLGD
jgi:tetratricopeptide (TPR) repeat protein